MLTPIKNVKVYEIIMNQIKDIVKSGELKRGDKLPSERDLALKLNVSRTSVREAIKALETLGLIESKHGEGNYIRSDFEDILLEPLSIVFMLLGSDNNEILQLRNVIEPEVAKIAAEKLQQLYPNAECSLNYSSPLEILIAVRLSAQCTDVRVNMVTPELFRRFTSLEDFANANPEEISEIIRPCGFFRTKSLDIVNICKRIISDFDGKIPNNIDDLTSFQLYFSGNTSSVSTSSQVTNENYIGTKKVCGSSYKLSGNYCVKTDTVNAVLK